MPIVIIKMLKGRTVEVKRKLAKDVTGVVSDDLKVPADETTVVIEEYDRENWARSGTLYSDK